MIQLTTVHKSACDRSGACCRAVMLNVSPRRLHELAKYPPSHHQAEAARIEAMLGECQGASDQPPAYTDTNPPTRYFFGPCKNLTTEVVDGVEKAACAIHQTRPALCWQYPGHQHNEKQLAEDKVPPGHACSPRNPAYMKGCGYNESPGAGWTVEELLASLRPLREDEKAGYVPPIAKPKRGRRKKEDALV